MIFLSVYGPSWIWGRLINWEVLPKCLYVLKISEFHDVFVGSGENDAIYAPFVFVPKFITSKFHRIFFNLYSSIRLFLYSSISQRQIHNYAIRNRRLYEENCIAQENPISFIEYQRYQVWNLL